MRILINKCVISEKTIYPLKILIINAVQVHALVMISTCPRPEDQFNYFTNQRGKTPSTETHPSRITFS